MLSELLQKCVKLLLHWALPASASHTKLYQLWEAFVVKKLTGSAGTNASCDNNGPTSRFAVVMHWREDWRKEAAVISVISLGIDLYETWIYFSLVQIYIQVYWYDCVLLLYIVFFLLKSENPNAFTPDFFATITVRLARWRALFLYWRKTLNTFSLFCFCV